MDFQGRFLDYVFKNCILVVLSHSTVVYELSAIQDFPLKYRFWKYPIVFHVGADPGPIFIHLEFIISLLLEGIIVWGDPYEVGVAVIWVTFHKNGCFPEPGIC